MKFLKALFVLGYYDQQYQPLLFDGRLKSFQLEDHKENILSVK